MAVFVADSKFAKEVGRRAFGCPEIRKKQNCLKLNSFSLPRRRKAFRPLGKPDCAIPRRAVRPSVDRTGGSWMYRSMRSLFEQVEGILARGKMFVPTEHPLAHVSRRADDGPRVAWTPASEMDPWSAELGSAPGQQAQNLFQNISPNISQNISQNFQVIAFEITGTSSAGSYCFLPSKQQLAVNGVASLGGFHKTGDVPDAVPLDISLSSRRASRQWILPPLDCKFDAEAWCQCWVLISRNGERLLPHSAAERMQRSSRRSATEVYELNFVKEAFLRFRSDSAEVNVSDLRDVLDHLGYLGITDEAAASLAKEVSRFSTLDFQELQKVTEHAGSWELQQIEQAFQRQAEQTDGVTMHVNRLSVLMLAIPYHPRLQFILHDLGATSEHQAIRELQAFLALLRMPRQRPMNYAFHAASGLCSSVSSRLDFEKVNRFLATHRAAQCCRWANWSSQALVDRAETLFKSIAHRGSGGRLEVTVHRVPELLRRLCEDDVSEFVTELCDASGDEGAAAIYRWGSVVVLVALGPLRPSHSMSLNEFLTWLRRLRCLHFRRTWQKYEEAPGSVLPGNLGSKQNSAFLESSWGPLDFCWSVTLAISSCKNGTDGQTYHDVLLGGHVSVDALDLVRSPVQYKYRFAKCALLSYPLDYVVHYSVCVFSDAVLAEVGRQRAELLRFELVDSLRRLMKDLSMAEAKYFTGVFGNFQSEECYGLKGDEIYSLLLDAKAAGHRLLSLSDFLSMMRACRVRERGMLKTAYEMKAQCQPQAVRLQSFLLRDMGLSDLSDVEETGSGLSVSDEEEMCNESSRAAFRRRSSVKQDAQSKTQVKGEGLVVPSGVLEALGAVGWSLAEEALYEALARLNLTRSLLSLVEFQSLATLLREEEATQKQTRAGWSASEARDIQSLYQAHAGAEGQLDEDRLERLLWDLDVRKGFGELKQLLDKARMLSSDELEGSNKVTLSTLMHLLRFISQKGLRTEADLAGYRDLFRKLRASSKFRGKSESGLTVPLLKGVNKRINGLVSWLMKSGEGGSESEEWGKWGARGKVVRAGEVGKVLANDETYRLREEYPVIVQKIRSALAVPSSEQQALVSFGVVGRRLPGLQTFQACVRHWRLPKLEDVWFWFVIEAVIGRKASEPLGRAQPEPCRGALCSVLVKARTLALPAETTCKQHASVKWLQRTICLAGITAKSTALCLTGCSSRHLMEDALLYLAVLLHDAILCPAPAQATNEDRLGMHKSCHDLDRDHQDRGRDAGSAVLQDLLQRPGPDLVRWAVEQAQSLSHPGTNVQRSQIFQMAGALNSASVTEKQELVRSAISGFGQLPADQRAEALRLVVNTAAAAQVGQTSAAQAQGEVPPLMQNVMVVMKEARLHEMPKEEQQILVQEARQDAVEMIQPQQVLEVVSELRPEERHQVTEALIEAKIVSEDQQPALEAALKPGGLADVLVSGMKLFTLAQENAWAFVAVPFGELFLALMLGVLTCSSGLNTWLRADAVYSLLTLAGAWFASQHLEQVLLRVKEDPMGTVRRWQLAEAQNQTLRRRLEETVPGVEFQAYQLGALGVVVAAAFLAVGLMNTLVGLFELLVTFIAGCSILVVLTSMAFLALRCVMVFGLLQVAGTLLTQASGTGVGAQRPLLEGGFSSGNEGHSAF
ncbi:unnamed protein product [Symbiodinium natans]|uniref:Uncharacterized protein n=1 Tax=Symbiodinium natans TaxID=878477 RepID=A0A812KGE2_9DINO|nr:unnamed protein product [Symbiodinium natans]